jgi:hypothetical protein
MKQRKSCVPCNQIDPSVQLDLNPVIAGYILLPREGEINRSNETKGYTQKRRIKEAQIAMHAHQPNNPDTL